MKNRRSLMKKHGQDKGPDLLADKSVQFQGVKSRRLSRYVTYPNRLVGQRCKKRIIVFKVGSNLVPVDFSECSLKAVHYGILFAEQFGSKLILVHIMESHPFDHLLGLKAAKYSNQWQLDQAHEGLKRMCAVLCLAAYGSKRGANRPVRKPIPSNLRAAREQSIIATQGRTRLQSLQLGIIARRVVHHSLPYARGARVRKAILLNPTAAIVNSKP